jgi:hypothetical protein
MLYQASNVIRTVLSSTMRWAAYLARMVRDVRIAGVNEIRTEHPKQALHTEVILTSC